MILTFIKLACRKIINDVSFSALSVTGLALATVSCTIILLYVGYEKSFDNFRSSDIYRVTFRGLQNDVETGRSAQVVPALAPAMVHDIPEVKSAVRFAHTGPFMADPVMQYNDKKFRESKIYFADNGLLSMFSYTMLAGSTTQDKPNQVAISKSVAQKYFGREEPIGKVLTFHRGERGATDLTVTGVFEDVPLNSHFHSDFIVSFSTLGFNLDNDWDWGNFYSYIQLQPGVNPDVVQSKIPELLYNRIGKYMSELAAEGFRPEFVLQPIRSIHLESNIGSELEMNGDITTVTFLHIIAIFILFIAWINYINFSIARSSENIKEISIRKINGSSRMQLIAQLLTESALINLMAVALSIVVVEVTLPAVKILVGIPEGISFGWENALIVVTIFVAGTLCSGVYPALYISKLNPVSILKDRITRSAMGLNLNKALIVFQFTASIVLIIGTVTVFRQLSFMRSQELGVDIQQTVIVKGPAVKDSTYQSTLSFFANETEKIPGVSSFAVSSSIPGEELHWGRSYSRKEDPDHSIGCHIVAIDEKFFDLYKAQFSAGKNFPTTEPVWQDAIIINESAARDLGFADPASAIDQIVLWSENSEQLPKTVIGVVKDFNQQSLRKKVEPIVFTLRKYVFAPWAGEYYAFKVNTRDIKSSLTSIEKLWKTTYPQNPFDYFFLDEYFNTQYKNDERFGKVFMIFSGLAIFIASLGLFGLTAYMTAMRTKEIGVRKVLGSTSFQLVSLLSRDYLKLVVIAFFLACPIALMLVNEWLSQFAYRIPLSIWIFVGAGFACFCIALLTVGIKSWKSANMDPVKALKYE